MRAYSQVGAVLFLYLSPTCGSCMSVIERIEKFDGAIGPVRVRALLPVHNDDLSLPMKNGRIPAEIVLQDPTGVTGRRLGLTSFPSAVIAGVDGKTAGGPVFGADEVIAMIDELEEVMQDADLPSAAELEQTEQERVARQRERRAGQASR